MTRSPPARRGPPHTASMRRRLVAVVTAAALIGFVVIDVVVLRSPDLVGPGPGDYVAAGTLTATPRILPGALASTGTWTEHCGRNADGHRNGDNLITSPGIAGGALHAHEYVGNVTASALSTHASLAAATTTCDHGDRSMYQWSVLRIPDSGAGPPALAVGGNAGRLIEPASVLVQWRGNPAGPVVAAPEFLVATTGNADAAVEHDADTEHVQWGCSGMPGRTTRSYPLCPAGQLVVRTFDFPSCWDGRRLDSPDHRSHLVFPAADGRCPSPTVAVPQLHLQIDYTVAPGRSFVVDAMPGEQHSPISDHADFLDVQPAELVDRMVTCIDAGRSC